MGKKKVTKKISKKKEKISLNKKQMVIIAVAVLGILLLSTGLSYAYFSATITNKDSGEETVITSGTMRINYSEGNKLDLTNAFPGASIYKEFSLENTGDVAAEYEIYLSEVLNTFVQEELVYKIESEEAGINIENQVVPTNSTKIVNKQTIGIGGTHHYRLEITFINKDSEQNYNQGAVFKGKISINTYKERTYEVNLTSNNNSNITMSNSVEVGYNASRAIKVTPSRGYYLKSVTCNNGYTTNAVVGEEATGEQTILITNNGTDNGCNCEIETEIKKYTLTLNYNGNGESEEEREKEYNEAYGELPSPSKTGYNFVGWFTETTGGEQVSSNTLMEDSDKTIYARFEPKQYEVTINTPSNGSVSDTSKRVNYGGTTTITVTPNEGYYLSGGTCTNGYTITNMNTGESYTRGQTITINNNSNENTSTCTFTIEALNALKYNVIGTYNSKQSQTIDIKNYIDNYKDLTLNNFFMKNVSIKNQTPHSLSEDSNNYILNSYNANTGILSLNKSSTYISSAGDIWLEFSLCVILDNSFNHIDIGAYYIDSENSINIANYTDKYRSLRTENFIVKNARVHWRQISYVAPTNSNLSYSYNTSNYTLNIASMVYPRKDLSMYANFWIID